MRLNYYLFKPGKLQREDQSVVFYSKDRKDYLPIGQIEIIFVFASIDINNNLLKLLDEYGVSIYFFSYFGKFIGRFMPTHARSGKNIIQHVHFIDNKVATQNLKRTMLLADIKNMLFVVKYYQKKRDLVFPFTMILERHIETLSKLDDDLDLLMVEANAKQEYYRLFDHVLLVPDFQFVSRSKHPPKNEINAMMSFGYALLYSLVEGSVQRSRLCIELPFQHGTSKTNTGLHHDIADIFKPIFIDRLILQMVNKRMISKKHFVIADDGVSMNKEGMSIFIDTFDSYMLTTVKINSRAYTYRQILSREVNSVSNLVNEGRAYIPFILTKW